MVKEMHANRQGDAAFTGIMRELQGLREMGKGEDFIHKLLYFGTLC